MGIHQERVTQCLPFLYHVPFSPVFFLGVQLQNSRAAQPSSSGDQTELPQRRVSEEFNSSKMHTPFKKNLIVCCLQMGGGRPQRDPAVSVRVHGADV